MPEIIDVRSEKGESITERIDARFKNNKMIKSNVESILIMITMIRMTTHRSLLLINNSIWCNYCNHNNYDKKRRNDIILYQTSTIPPWSLACLWNMKIWGNIAAASRYIEYVQLTSDSHSRFKALYDMFFLSVFYHID